MATSAKTRRRNPERRKAEPKLTTKQRLFVEAYTGVSRGNATDAARQAGYKGNDVTLQAVGKENLRKPLIAKAIKPRINQLVGDLILGREELQALWTKWSLDKDASRRDQMKATELLAKSQGIFVEKREITRPGAGKPKRKPPTPAQVEEKIKRVERMIAAHKAKREPDARADAGRVEH